MPPRRDEAPQWVCSNDVVDDGDGRVTFNRLQQSLPEPDDGCEPDVITTDPHAITDAP